MIAMTLPLALVLVPVSASILAPQQGALWCLLLHHADVSTHEPNTSKDPHVPLRRLPAASHQDLTHLPLNLLCEVLTLETPKQTTPFKIKIDFVLERIM